MKRSIPLLVLGFSLQACAVVDETPSPNELLDAWKAELIEADQAFSDAISQQGLEGWAAYFTDDGTMIQEGAGEIRGRETIGAAMDNAANAITSFSWSPERAEVSNGGDLGYTVGNYQTTMVGPEGEELHSTGLYVSIWRRQEDGGWKVEMDLGNPVTGPGPVSSGDPAEGDTGDHP